ncbi:hypothetical protein NA57DRAFT_55620 [Rhizodiscina lignyota]|uniref:DNA recombination and repair protein Rad51-like C-terminal domain-containing protein n=1 Tax=Rhizodiscina lignyota TaxID=1504668 RepID=A0A9P4II25_9PEZI|nr:hypothetical protein NA57DRAFT_55620 [Rhizodiscina lignyota]
MSAQELGKRLLGEVVEVGLDELFREIRHLHDNDGQNYFNIPIIDNLLNEMDQRASNPRPVAEHASENAFASSPGHPTALAQTTNIRKRRPIVELTSSRTGAGTTHLLYLIAALAVLPHGLQGTTIGGKDTAIVIIDTDDRFDVQRFARLMNAHISSVCEESTKDGSSPPNSPQQEHQSPDEVIQRSLEHVHIFRPQSLPSLVATVTSLESYLFDFSAHLSSRKQLGTIILDSASAFYWQHRSDEEAARFRATERGSSVPKGKSELSVYGRLLKALEKAQDIFDCSVVYTSQSSPISVTSDNNVGGFRVLTDPPRVLRQLLPPAWTSFPALTLFLERENAVQFVHGMCVEEAWPERKMRQDIVEKGRFVAVPGNDIQKRRFTFTITDEGCVFEDLQEEKT